MSLKENKPFVKIVSDSEEGIRLDRWFKKHFPNLQHALLQKLLRKGAIKLSGKKCQSSTRLEAGQEIRGPTFKEDEALRSHKESQEKPLSKAGKSMIDFLKKAILYEDADILALNKPAGLAIQGGSKTSLHLDGLLKYLTDLPEGETLKLVHRLDKDTSGVVLLAKNAKAAHYLMRQFKERLLEKLYWAMVVGAMPRSEGKIDFPILKQEEKGLQREKMQVNFEEGQRAVTFYKVCHTIGKKAAWVAFKPLTGRTHQIRIHAASIGAPVLGDGKYGGKEAFIKTMELSEQLHLHARAIRLRVPSGKEIIISASLPLHMQQTWQEFNLPLTSKPARPEDFLTRDG